MLELKHITTTSQFDQFGCETLRYTFDIIVNTLHFNRERLESAACHMLGLNPDHHCSRGTGSRLSIVELP